MLRYDVVLTGLAAAQVIHEFDCPIYLETLANAAGQYMLNCNGSEGILVAVGESVRFHIELPIPAGAVLGQSTLSWTPIEPAGPELTATITIVA